MGTLPPSLPPSNSRYAAGPSLVELLLGGRLAGILGRFCLILLLVICEEQSRSNLERRKRSRGWSSATQHLAWEALGSIPSTTEAKEKRESCTVC